MRIFYRTLMQRLEFARKLVARGRDSAPHATVRDAHKGLLDVVERLVEFLLSYEIAMGEVDLRENRVFSKSEHDSDMDIEDLIRAVCKKKPHGRTASFLSPPLQIAETVNLDTTDDEATTQSHVMQSHVTHYNLDRQSTKLVNVEDGIWDNGHPILQKKLGKMEELSSFLNLFVAEVPIRANFFTEMRALCEKAGDKRHSSEPWIRRTWDCLRTFRGTVCLRIKTHVMKATTITHCHDVNAYKEDEPSTFNPKELWRDLQNAKDSLRVNLEELNIDPLVWVELHRKYAEFNVAALKKLRITPTETKITQRHLIGAKTFGSPQGVAGGDDKDASSHAPSPSRSPGETANAASVEGMKRPRGRTWSEASTEDGEEEE